METDTISSLNALTNTNDKNSGRKRFATILREALIVVSLIVLVVTLYKQHKRNQATFTPEGMRQQEMLYRAECTLDRGMILQEISNQFFTRFHRFPTLQECTNIMNTYLPGPNEFLSDDPTGKIVESFDGLGGWYYDAKAGRILLNRDGFITVMGGITVKATDISFYPTLHIIGRINSTEEFRKSGWWDPARHKPNLVRNAQASLDAYLKSKPSPNQRE